MKLFHILTLATLLAVPVAVRAGVTGAFTSGGFVSTTFKGVAGQSSIGRSSDGTQQRGLILVQAVAEPPQSGPNFVVTNTADTNDGTCGATDCTLREAINAVNADTGTANNTITFDATTFAARQTITLSNGLLPLINTDISINGPTASGVGVTIDANGKSGIFGVIGGTSTFSNLSLMGGNNNGGYGGAIQQGGASRLTLNFCTLSGNTASNGGAIFTNAMLTLNSCTLSVNIADGIRGGGIYNQGTLLLNSCTLSGNSGGDVGGIFSERTLTLNSCTLSGNSGGVGGGIFINSGTLNLNNSLVAGNTTTSTRPDISGTINTGDYNLIGNTQGTIFSGNPAHNITNVDPKLGALGNNGGPTQTIALLAGGAAVDAGNTPLTTDQRGFKRPFDFPNVANASGGNGSDIGAFELNETPQSGANFVVNQTDDHDDGVCGPTDCTLREAMNAAENDGSNSTITFDATVFAAKQTIALNGSALPAILSTIVITGPKTNGAGVTIDAGGKSGIFAIGSRPTVGDLTLSDLSLVNGSSNSGGGGIFNNGGNLTLTSCTLSGNSTNNVGGGIYNIGTATLTNCTLANNINTSSRLAFGGGIFNQGTLNLTNCTVSGNSAPNGRGGGIFNPGTLNLSNSIVAGNSTNIDGTLATDDHNIIGGTVAAAGLQTDANGNAVLADNGGPTQTIALTTVGTAVDTGNSTLTTDQRGAQRPLGGAPDIGAFESSLSRNSAPTVSDIAVSVNEDAAAGLTFAASDFDKSFKDPDAGDTLQSVRIASLPAHGVLTIAGNAATAGQVIARANLGTLIYAPAANFNGADSFGYNASDGALFAAQNATVNITVNAVNDAPSFIVGGNQTAAEASGSQSVANFAMEIKAGPADESAQQLSFAVTNDNAAVFSVQPAIAADGTLTYTLNTKAAGTANVSVILKDNGGVAAGGKDASAAQNFTIVVTANPINFGVSIVPNGPFTRDMVTANLVAPAGTDATYAYQWFVNGVSVQTGASNTLDLSKPGQGDKGETITVTASASNTRGGVGSASNFARVRNSAPFAFSGTATAKSGVETLIRFAPFGNPGGGDADNDALTYKRVGGPGNGVAAFTVGADGSNVLRYTSRVGFVGVEVVKFVAVDDEGRTSNVATLGISVKGTPLSDPTAKDAVGKTQSGVSVDVPIIGNDPNGGIVTFQRVGGPKNGTGGLVTLPDGTTVMRYVPRANFVGVEEIRFVALNAAGRPSNVATIRITVSASKSSASNASAIQMGDAPSGGSS